MTALLITFGAFALILILARLKVPLAAAILIGTIGLGGCFGLGPIDILGALGSGLIAAKTIALAIMIGALLALSNTMRLAGQLENIVALTGSLLRRPALAMAALPAVVGMVPMPGGAVFSAPMVRTAAGKARIDGATLSAVNYWYRHIWEYWWPLYPGVILACSMARVRLWTFMLMLLPLGAFMVVSGLPILLRAHRGLRAGPHTREPGVPRKLIRATSSIWLIMIIWAIGKAVLWRLGPVGQKGSALHTAMNYAPVTVGLFVSLLWTIRMNRMPAGRVAEVFRTKSLYTLVGVVVAVMLFSFMLERTGAPDQIAKKLQALHVPPEAVVAMLPFIAGMVTGLAVGFVGASFPIVMVLVRELPGPPNVWPYVVLAYAAGYLGMMLSPLHVCHIVSNRYFEIGFRPVYRRTVPAAVIMAALTLAYAFCLQLGLNGWRFGW